MTPFWHAKRRSLSAISIPSFRWIPSPSKDQDADKSQKMAEDDSQAAYKLKKHKRGVSFSAEPPKIIVHPDPSSIRENLDPDAPAFQPGAPLHPMVPGVAFSLAKRRRKIGVGAVRGTTAVHPPSGLNTEIPQPTPQTELEYLTSLPLSTRNSSSQDQSQILLGCEDVWILLLQNTRTAPDQSLSGLMGRLLVDLEEFFYPDGLLVNPWEVVALGIRDEAMLEEAGRLVRFQEGKLGQLIEYAKIVEVARKGRRPRRTV